MDSSEERITFDNLPKAVATLLEEVRSLKDLTENLTTYGGFSPWMDVEELCEYLPGHPAKCTIYSWIHDGFIPFHRCGKTFCFYRPDIDRWIRRK